jgi:ribosomal-protein-alanine N-acetyltransferase
LIASIRPYTKKDKNAVLLLFDHNVPSYFSANEKPDLEHYLENEIEQYFVIEKDNQIVGCGGINFDSTKTKGVISWDIIHPAYQNEKLGTKLLKYRIALLKEMSNIKSIIVRTSQHIYKFYQKQGFNLLETTKDYWAPGFDLYYMEYKNVESI